MTTCPGLPGYDNRIAAGGRITRFRGNDMHSTRALSPGAGWSWLRRAINLGRRNPRAIFGAAALLALVALMPSLVQLLLQYGLKLGAESTLMVVGAMSLVMMVIYPLLIGGLLRVIDAAEHGRPTRAMAIFDTFRSGNGGAQLIGFGVLLSAIYIAVFVLVIWLFGKELFAWYMELLSSGMAAEPGTPPQLPELPDGFGTVMALGTVVGLLFSGIYALGFGQVALGGRGIGGALGDGVSGTLKNLLPIVVLAIVSVASCIAFVLVLVLVMAVLGGLVALVSKALAFVVVLPLYLGMLLVMYVVMFGVMYYMWRDICAAPLAPQGAQDDRLEL